MITGGIYKWDRAAVWDEVYLFEGYYEGYSYRGLNDIICAGDELIAVGTSGVIVTSEDGENWTRVDNTDSQLAFFNVAEKGNEIFVFGAQDNFRRNNSLRYKRTIEGTWIELEPPASSVGDAYIAVTPYAFTRSSVGIVEFSYDGVNWNELYKSPYNWFRYVATDGENVVLCVESYGMFGKPLPIGLSVESKFISPKGKALSNTGNSGTVIANVTLNNPDKVGAVIVAALYRGNQLVSASINSTPLYNADNTANLAAIFYDVQPQDVIKTFVWESMISLRPLL